MTLPEQLGDWTSHRVADGDASLNAQLAGQGGDVIGTVLESERCIGAQAAPVPAVVDGDHAEAARERRETRSPVERGSCRPSVQQHDDRRSLWPGYLANERATSPRQLDHASRRKPRPLPVPARPAHDPPAFQPSARGRGPRPDHRSRLRPCTTKRPGTTSIESRVSDRSPMNAGVPALPRSPRDSARHSLAGGSLASRHVNNSVYIGQ